MLQRVIQQPIGPSKQPIRTRYLGHVTGYQPIGEQYFLVRFIPDVLQCLIYLCPLVVTCTFEKVREKLNVKVCVTICLIVRALHVVCMGEVFACYFFTCYALLEEINLSCLDS